jgi:hypothetical protein
MSDDISRCYRLTLEPASKCSSEQKSKSKSSTSAVLLALHRL